MKKNLFMGVDPGGSGCFAILDREGKFVDQIRMDETLLDIGKKLRSYRRDIAFAVIEQVNGGKFGSGPICPVCHKPRFQQGIQSAFKFGDSFGLQRGMVIVCNIRHEYVRPADWQKVMGCRTKGDKNVSKAAAQRLFPETKIIHINADSLLIAEYARRLGLERGW